MRRLEHLPQVLSDWRRWLRLQKRELGVSQRAGQDVVEVMGNAARKLPQRLQLLRLAQLDLEQALGMLGLSLLGNVFDGVEDARPPRELNQLHGAARDADFLFLGAQLDLVA